MFENLLLLLQKPNQDELSVLSVIKKWFARRQVRPNDISRLNQTALCSDILIEAANSKWANVLSYLLHKGFDPSITTAPFGFNLLHHVVNLGSSHMAEVILGKCPELIDTQSREGATALFLAVQHQHHSLVTLLLRKGASPNQTDLHGLTPLGVGLLTLNPEIIAMLLKNPSTSPVLFEDLRNQRNLLSSVMALAHDNKMRSLNLLFAAGAGLELTHIPAEVFSLYGISPNQLKDFLILAHEKQADGSFKKRLIGDLATLTQAVNNPKWVVETHQIARACQHPLLAHLPTVQAVKKLLNIEVQLVLPTLPVTKEVTRSKPITELPANLLINEFNNEMQIQKASLCSIQNIMLQTKSSSRLLPLMNCIMESVYAITALWQNRHMDLEKSVQQFHNFNSLIKVLMPLVNHNIPIEGLAVNQLLDEKLKTLLKRHGDILKSKHLALYNSLIDARALVLGKMNRAYLALGKSDVAINLSLEAIAVNDSMIIDNPHLQCSANYNKAISLVNACEVYLSQGWVSKAVRHTFLALELLTTDISIYDPLIVKQVQQLANIFAARYKTMRSLALITQAINYLEKVIPNSDAQECAVKSDIQKLHLQHSQLLACSFKERVALVSQILDATCEIVIDETIHAVYLMPKALYRLPSQESYFSFLENNHDFAFHNGNQLLINKETLLSKSFPIKIHTLAQILSPKAQVEPVAIDGLLANMRLEEKEETYGFEKPEGFTRIVPIESQGLPKNTLFVTMPENSESFTPFYKLIRNKEKTVYFSVPTIAPKGLNQHGVKLSTTKVTSGSEATQKVAYCRLKVGGTLRAKGHVEQTVVGENGKQRKLYVCREVTDKKQEQRLNYK